MEKQKKTSKTGSKPKASKRSQPEEPEKKDFLVVGLGASAGGIRALQEFFGTMPPNSGMAFAVVLHLSPEHESNLSDIIQARTTMPVTVVDETQRVEPNHVYVIPPNRQLEMVDGVIRSSDLRKDRGERVAIDVFFRTLAEAYHRNAVCIVMSGTGMDGTLGLKAVKEADGFAIVQSPEDADHDSMPRSAIETQLVDWVLPVRQMPEKLIQFRDSSERLHLSDADADGRIAKEIQANESLREILTILRVRTGHDFSNYKTPTLVRRIARHLQIHDLPDIPAYLEYLREKPEEIHSLLKNLLINVTNFFRDPEAWNVLKNEVVPSLFKDKSAGDTIRVWSCGCASGEEAYSLAMLLFEYAEKLHDPPKIQVFATDVDEDAIGEARENRYPESIEADVSIERLKRFFIKDGKHYRLKKELRESVLFAQHNVLRDPPFSRLDLIACRNLLIYLNRDTQSRVLEIFHFALMPHGYLYLGSSETAEAVPALFAPHSKKHRIYTRRPLALSQQPTPQMPILGRLEAKIPEIKTGKTDVRPFSLGEVHFKLLESFAPPSVLVNEDFDIQYLSESAGRFLKFRGGEPSNNILKLIHTDLLPDLRTALFNAQREKKTIEFPNVRTVLEDGEVNVRILVRPVEIGNETTRYLLVLIIEENGIVLPNGSQTETVTRRVEKEDAMQAVAARLEEELARAKSNLRSTIEQHEVSVEELKASNEELQAINEELRSTTEELETSKEELQSVNEELTTVNQELKEKIDESARINSDLHNLISSTEIATIFLDRNLCIKRITPLVEQLFNITTLDYGRPFDHFTHRLEYKNLVKDAAEVLKRLQPIEREVNDNYNRSYMARFAPYRSIDDRIEGVVLNFIDITGRKKAEELVADELKDMLILHRLSTVTANEEKIQILYDEILKAAIELTHADASTVQIYDEKTEALEILATEGFDLDMTTHFHRVDASSNTPYGIALKLGKRTFVDYDKNKKDSTSRLHLEAGFLSAQSTPLIARSGKPIGMFTTHWRVRRRPTERELRFLDILARQAADLIDHWQTSKALQRSEEKYRTLFDSVDEGFCTIEVMFNASGKALDYRFLETNPAFVRQTGIENGVGRTIREFAPEHEEFWFETYGRIARTGESMRFKHNAAALGRFYDVYAFRIGEPGENRVAVIFNDITERNRREANLAFLAEIAEDFSRLSTAEEIMQAVGAKLGEFLKIQYCHFLLIDEARDEARYLDHWKTPDAPSLPEKVSLSAHVNENFLKEVRAHRTVVCNDTLTDPRMNGEETVKLGASAFVTVPFHQDGEWKYLFSVHDRSPRKWRTDEIELVQELANRLFPRLERARTEQELRESEQRMRIALDASRLGTWEWDLETDKIYWNERHFTLLGLRPHANPVDLQTFFRRVHPDHRARLQKELQMAIETKSVFDSEFSIFRPDGATRWMSGYGQVKETGADNEVTKMSGVMFDITARKEAEESLRKSEEQLKLILESTKDYAIITFDLKGHITRWNAGAERIFGYTEKEVIGELTHLIFTPEDVAARVPEKELASTLKNGRAEDERWHIRKDGTRFFASGVMQLLRNGELEGFVKICRDQTARLEAEQSALEREMLRRMVSAQEDERRRIARDIHDHFGQQLTALRLMLDTIKKAAAGNQEVIAFTDEAQKAAAELDANVDFIAWELRPAALDDLGLRAALANFVSEWSKHTGINAEFHASRLSRARLDYDIETNLYRIAQEALNNIQKHAGANHVSVLLEKSRNKVSLIVEDNGIGFNPADKANRKKGIGLIGMIERAKICGGELEIESAKGKGTTVFARIPVKKE